MLGRWVCEGRTYKIGAMFFTISLRMAMVGVERVGG
jgi:hypothetical protein